MLTDDLPNSLESEIVVLGRILLDPPMIDSVSKKLTPDRFYNQSHKKIFAAMLELRETEQAISPISIGELLRDPSIPISYVTNLTLPEKCPAFLPIEADVGRIISTSRKRWLVKFAEYLDEMARNGKGEDEILEFASTRIEEAKTKLPQAKRQPRFLSSMVDDQAARYRLWHKGIANAIPTGFADVDDKLLGGGFVKSGLYILAARPSMGKTALALDIAANMAGAGRTVYMWSREMPGESLFDRLHSAYSGVSRWKFRPGIWEREYHKLIETLPELAMMKIILDDSSETVTDVRAELKDFSRKGIEIDCLMGDYLQLFASAGRTRNEEVGKTSRALKTLAMDFNFPVLALSQLSRACDQQHREPELADLRDSGEIEQDADAVFFLFGDRPEEGTRFFSRQFKCAKQRDGELFRRELTFNGELVTFRTIEQLGAA